MDHPNVDLECLNDPKVGIGLEKIKGCQSASSEPDQIPLGLWFTDWAPSDSQLCHDSLSAANESTLRRPPFKIYTCAFRKLAKAYYGAARDDPAVVKRNGPLLWLFLSLRSPSDDLASQDVAQRTWP